MLSNEFAGRVHDVGLDAEPRSSTSISDARGKPPDPRQSRKEPDVAGVLTSIAPSLNFDQVGHEENAMSESRQAEGRNPASMPSWGLGEAKAKFSEVVRLAASGRPQRVTVHGQNAVVVVAVDEFERLQAGTGASSLHELLSRSPLNRLEFESESVEGPVREVEL